jgi:catechol 2,3-dioxygenase-like lactoylglutathione lyase family enzyme
VKSTPDLILRTSDLEGAKAYYHGVLGFPIVPDSPMLGFETGALTLYFERGDPDGPVAEFAVDDVQATKAKLITAGCTLVEENAAIPRVYLRDRFGLVFNLTKA